MKKSLILVMCMLSILSTTACGSDDEKSSSLNSSDEVSAIEEVYEDIPIKDMKIPASAKCKLERFSDLRYSISTESGCEFTITVNELKEYDTNNYITESSQLEYLKLWFCLTVLLEDPYENSDILDTIESESMNNSGSFNIYKLTSGEVLSYSALMSYDGYLYCISVDNTLDNNISDYYSEFENAVNSITL